MTLDSDESARLDAFLDSYESERKPVSTHCADWALLAFMNHTVIDAGIGLTPGAPVIVATPRP